MRVLHLPKNFPDPQSMRQSPVPTWIKWIREESERIVKDLEEEMKPRNDPDDPFDGTASGIFNPLEFDTRPPLIPLPEQKGGNVRNQQKTEKSRLSPPNNHSNEMSVPFQDAQINQREEGLQTESNRRNDSSNKSSEKREQTEGSTGRRISEVRKQRYPLRERLIDFPAIPESSHNIASERHLEEEQMSENSHYPFRQEPPLQLAETGGGQQGDIVKNDVCVPPKSQRKNDYSQNWPHERVWDENSIHSGPSPEEERDPLDTVRSFHRRQRELINPSPSTPSLGIRRRRQTGNDNNMARDTPKPQREGREKRRTFQNGIRCSSVEPLDEISYIPKDSQPMAGRNFMDGNANHIDLTLYMQLPPVGQDNRICGKCGQQGHVKRYCLANANCDFCKTKSHATLACRTYANFVKEHPLTSSRKNTPEKIRSEIDVDMEVARRVELELRKWQRERVPTGKPPIPQPRRQQEMNRDLYVDQRKYQSQDIHVQLGETVHTKLHQAQSGRYPQGVNYLRLKANNQFIAEESVQDPPEEEVNYESESRQRSSPSDVELQESQRRINANIRFIAEE